MRSGTSFGSLHVKGHAYAAVLAGRPWIGEVCRQFSYAFDAAQSFGKEHLRCRKLFGVLGLFLPGNKLRVGAYLRLDSLALEQITNLLDEQVIRRSVANQVVYIAQQIDGFLGAHDSKTAQEILGQIERLHKGVLVSLQFLFSLQQFTDSEPGYLLHLLAVNALHDAILGGDEMYEQSGVIRHGRPNGLPQGFRRGSQRQTDTQRNVIECGCRILGTFEIDTGLSITQRRFIQRCTFSASVLRAQRCPCGA